MKTLPNDYARCAGMWVEDGEHSSWREGCEHCLRRTSPRPEMCQMIEPPPIIAFQCEHLIDQRAEAFLRTLGLWEKQPNETKI